MRQGQVEQEKKKKSRADHVKEAMKQREQEKIKPIITEKKDMTKKKAEIQKVPQDQEENDDDDDEVPTLQNVKSHLFLY
jgi:hypothetical protein